MPRRYYLLLTLTVLAAAFLRIWQLASAPPGLHYDLAATALLGNEVAFNGYRPIFISAYTGHEVLYYYWLALWFRLVGSSVFTLRLASAMLGILAVPATFFAVREVMRFDQELSYPLAALAAVFLATAFWNLVFSRYGFRVISQPVVQALAIGFLFKGLWNADDGRRTTLAPALRAFASAGVDDTSVLHRPASVVRRRLFVFRRLSSVVRRHRGPLYLIFAGLFTGLAAYTYLAARLFPVPLAVFWVALLAGGLLARRRAGRALRGGLSNFVLFGLAALATFAPLGIYFLNNPQDFLNRASQLAPRPGESGLLLSGVTRALQMLFLKGEPYSRFNLPGQPLFSSILGFFFVVGLLITLKNAVWGHPREKRGPAARPPSPATNDRLPLPRAAEIFLLAWLPAMLLPTAIAVHDIFPSNMRATGLIPLLFVFPARGLLVSYRWVQRRMPGPLIPYAYPLVVLTLAALGLGGYSAWQDYTLWDHLPDQRQNNDADLVDMATYLDTHDTSADAVYVSAIHYRHPTLAYLAHDFDQLHWLTGGSALIIPAGQPALYLFARSAPLPSEWTLGWAPHQVAAPPDADGLPAYRAYQFAAGETPPLPAFTPLDENFGNFVTLTGYHVLTDGQQVLLDLRWRVENVPPAGDYLPYARLADAWGSGWSQSGGFSDPSEQWQPGDTVLTRLSLPLPAGLPPGDYKITAGFYSAGANQNLPHLDAAGAFVGEVAPISRVNLSGGAFASVDEFQQANSAAALPTPSGRCILPGDNGALIGASLERATLRQGEVLHLSLDWIAPFAPGPNEIRIGLGAQTLYTGQPVHGTFPFAQWPEHLVLTDRYALKVPVDAPAGPLPLTATYNTHNGPMACPLGTVTVEAVDRLYTPPAVGVKRIPADSIFGDRQAALYGYTLTPGRTTTLQLVWQSLAPIDQDYSVFIHVLDGNGQLAAQADAEPRGGTYATSMWQPGEYITDDYHFDLPPGDYTIELGLYRPEDGYRLPPVFDDTGSLRLPEFSVP